MWHSGRSMRSTTAYATGNPAMVVVVIAVAGIRSGTWTSPATVRRWIGRAHGGHRGLRCSLVTEFLAVEFVGILVMRDFAGFGGERRGCEVGMLEGVDSVDSFAPVQFQELREE